MSVNNSRPIPENSILDLNGKQAYLGNAYAASTNRVTVPLGSTETPLLYISNPIANALPQNFAVYNDSKRFLSVSNSDGSANFCVFKYYLSTPSVSGGSAITPVNVRPATSNASIMTVTKSPTVSGTAQVQTIDTVPDVAGSLNNTYFYISDVNASGTQKNWYVWFNVNSAGTDPAISGKTGISVALATGATANTVATAIRTALNALASDFVATGATSHVIATNVNAGACNPSSDGAQPTSFTFHNTTAGSSSYGTYLGIIGVTVVQNDDHLLILDPGQSLLVTVTTPANNIEVGCDISWFEQ